jgi:hypothetical protein
MRQALREFLRTRALSTVDSRLTPAPTDLLEFPVRLRAEEIETFAAYGKLVGNGQSTSDILAELVRRGDLELKVSELVQRARDSVHRGVAQRERLDGLSRSVRDLERKGVVGR